MGKLKVELVPKTCFYSNVRTLLPKKYGAQRRKDSYENASNRHEICGDTGNNQGYIHNVESDQIWEYADALKVEIVNG